MRKTAGILLLVLSMVLSAIPGLAEEKKIPNLAYTQWGMTDETTVRAFEMGSRQPESSANVVKHLTDLDGTWFNMERTIYAAVIDGFVDHTHPDLQDVMVQFSAEEQKALGCGEWGYNASDFGGGGQEEKDFIPNSHATHCAGLLGANWDGHGLSGTASRVKIVSIQVVDPDPTKHNTNFLDSASIVESSTVRAFAFVDKYNSYYQKTDPDKMIRVVSMSIGSQGSNRTLDAQIYELGRKYGTLTFISAGNDTQNNDTNTIVSGSLRRNPYAFVVAAIDQSGQVAVYSNYGAETVTLAAPGSMMLSCAPMNEATYFPGIYPTGPADGNDIFYENFGNENWPNRVKIVQLDANSNKSPNEAITYNGPDVPYWSGNHSVSMKVDHDLCELLVDDGGDYLAKFMITLYLTKEEINAMQEHVNCQFGCVFSGRISGIMQDEILAYYGSRSQSTSILPLKRKSVQANGTWSVIATGAGEEQTLMSTIPDVRDETNERLNFEISFRARKDVENVTFDSIGIGSSTFPYHLWNGTSMATPFAAGCAAVYASRHPEENGIQLASRIRASVTPTPELKGMSATDGRIDMANDVSGSWKDPGMLKPSWALYENTLPLDTSTADPFRKDALGDTETCGPLVELNGKLWYFPPYFGEGREDRSAVFIYHEIRCFDPQTNTWEAGRAGKIQGGPLWNLSVCAWNGELWLYGLEGNISADGRTYNIKSTDDQKPHIYSFNPGTGTWREHSVKNIARPGAMILLADADGLKFFDNGTLGLENSEEMDPMGSGKIYAYDPSAGLGSLIADLGVYMQDVQIASHGSTVWIAETKEQDPAGIFQIENGKVTKLKATLPKGLLEMNPRYSEHMMLSQAKGFKLEYFSMTAGEEALYIVGYTDENKKADTWVLPYGGSALQPYGKHLSVLRPFSTAAAFYDGKIYAIAGDWGEVDSRVFRSTRVEDAEPEKEEPKPEEVTPIPKTGDSSPLLLWSLMVLIPLTGLAGSFIRNRRRPH